MGQLPSKVEGSLPGLGTGAMGTLRQSHDGRNLHVYAALISARIHAIHLVVAGEGSERNRIQWEVLALVLTLASTSVNSKRVKKKQSGLLRPRSYCHLNMALLLLNELFQCLIVEPIVLTRFASAVRTAFRVRINVQINYLIIYIYIYIYMN